MGECGDEKCVERRGVWSGSQHFFSTPDGIRLESFSEAFSAALISTQSTHGPPRLLTVPTREQEPRQPLIARCSLSLLNLGPRVTSRAIGTMSSVNGIAHAYPASTAVNGKEATASSTTASISGEAATKPNNDPSEIGWLFVPNYYSVLNQAPDKLHRFYTKKSTLVHGVEQEDATPCFGQQVRSFAGRLSPLQLLTGNAAHAIT